MQGEKAAKGKFSTKAGAAKGAIRYAVHRENEEGKQQFRNLFDKREEVSKEEAYERMDADKQRYTYTLILNPGERDSRGVDMQQVTRDVMGKLEERGLCREWVAVEHRDHTDFAHVHVIAKSDAKLTPQDFQEMRREEFSSYERQAEAFRDAWQDREAERLHEQHQGEERGR